MKQTMSLSVRIYPTLPYILALMCVSLFVFVYCFIFLASHRFSDLERPFSMSANKIFKPCTSPEEMRYGSRPTPWKSQVARVKSSNFGHQVNSDSDLIGFIF